jgi:hypothetical protein
VSSHDGASGISDRSHGDEMFDAFVCGVVAMPDDAHPVFRLDTVNLKQAKELLDNLD